MRKWSYEHSEEDGWRFVCDSEDRRLLGSIFGTDGITFAGFAKIPVVGHLFKDNSWVAFCTSPSVRGFVGLVVAEPEYSGVGHDPFRILAEHYPESPGVGPVASRDELPYVVEIPARDSFYPDPETYLDFAYAIFLADSEQQTRYISSLGVGGEGRQLASAATRFSAESRRRLGAKELTTHFRFPSAETSKLEVQLNAMAMRLATIEESYARKEELGGMRQKCENFKSELSTLRETLSEKEQELATVKRALKDSERAQTSDQSSINRELRELRSATSQGARRLRFLKWCTLIVIPLVLSIIVHLLTSVATITELQIVKQNTADLEETTSALATVRDELSGVRNDLNSVESDHRARALALEPVAELTNLSSEEWMEQFPLSTETRPNALFEIVEATSASRVLFNEDDKVRALASIIGKAPQILRVSQLAAEAPQETLRDGGDFLVELVKLSNFRKNLLTTLGGGEDRPNFVAHSDLEQRAFQQLTLLRTNGAELSEILQYFRTGELPRQPNDLPKLRQVDNSTVFVSRGFQLSKDLKPSELQSRLDVLTGLLRDAEFLKAMRQSSESQTPEKLDLRGIGSWGRLLGQLSTVEYLGGRKKLSELPNSAPQILRDIYRVSQWQSALEDKEFIRFATERIDAEIERRLTAQKAAVDEILKLREHKIEVLSHNKATLRAESAAQLMLRLSEVIRDRFQEYGDLEVSLSGFRDPITIHLAFDQVGPSSELPAGRMYGTVEVRRLNMHASAKKELETSLQLKASLGSRLFLGGDGRFDSERPISIMEADQERIVQETIKVAFGGINTLVQDPPTSIHYKFSARSR